MPPTLAPRSFRVRLAIAGSMLLAGLAASSAMPDVARGQTSVPEPWLSDRGHGVRTSIFGTYVRSGELLVSPFFEYYFDDNFEYKPEELGHSLDRDFRGKFRASEGLVFLSYGISDRLAVELEAAVISATLRKAPEDPSTLPARLDQSGQGDWQVQLDWTAVAETAGWPELFGFVEVTPPSNRKSLLIGTSDWELKWGGGVNRGMPWGTVTARAAAEYVQGGGVVDLGEYAVEYLKRLSPRWRLYAGIEGSQDEVELIGEAQLHLSERTYLRLNLARGLSSKATDWGPDIGVVFALPVGGRAGKN